MTDPSTCIFWFLNFQLVNDQTLLTDTLPTVTLRLVANAMCASYQFLQHYFLGWHLSTTSPKFKTSASPRVKNQAKVAGDLCGWARNSWKNSNGRSSFTECGKKGLITWEEYRKTVRACRDATKKFKSHLELYLAKEVEDNRKGFFKYTNNKRKTRENMNLLLNEVGTLVTEDTEKVDLLNTLFSSVFIA